MLILDHSLISFQMVNPVAPSRPLKQPMWLLSRHVDLKAAKEGSWHVCVSKVGMREEEAAVIELTKFFVSCLGLSGLQKRVKKCQVLGLALSHAEAAFQCGSGASAQGDFFFLALLFLSTPLVLGC